MIRFPIPTLTRRVFILPVSAGAATLPFLRALKVYFAPVREFRLRAASGHSQLVAKTPRDTQSKRHFIVNVESIPSQKRQTEMPMFVRRED